MGEEVNLFSLNPEANPLLGLTLREGAHREALLVMVVLYVAGLALASFYDLWRGRQTPNWFTHGTALVGVVVAPLAFEDWQTHYVVAGLIGLVAFVGYWYGAVGAGDVKLYVGIGLLFGPAAIFILAAAHVIGGCVCAPYALLRRVKKFAVPMFPFAMIGVLLALPGVGAPYWVTVWGAGLLAVVVALGLIERTLRPLPGIAEMTEHLSDTYPVVRLRAGSGPLVRIDNRWEPLEGVRKVSQGAIDLIVQRIVPADDWKLLDATSELTVPHPVDAPTVEVFIRETLTGYTLDLTRLDA